MSQLLEVVNLRKTFTERSNIFSRKKEHVAVDSISFTLDIGETIGIIGENGSGKSTVARMLAGVTLPTSGEIYVNNEHLQPKDYQSRAKLIRMIFQDPNTSLNPRLTIGQILQEPLLRNTDMNEQQRIQRVSKILQRVGLLTEHINFYANMLSAGQKRRICLARALILQPSIIIADETLNGLDSSTQAQTVNLLLALQQEMNLAYIFVSQHIGMIKHISDKIIVMQQGKVIESGTTSEVFDNPQHKFTKKLIEHHFNPPI